MFHSELTFFLWYNMRPLVGTQHNREQQVTARIHPKTGALKNIYSDMHNYEQRLHAAKLDKVNDDVEMTCIMYTQKKANMHRDVLPRHKP